MVDIPKINGWILPGEEFGSTRVNHSVIFELDKHLEGFGLVWFGLVWLGLEGVREVF